MDWTNINLAESYERSQNLLEPYSFDTLLLEVHCNIQNISKETIKQQFEFQLQQKIDEAREVFQHNLNNIYKEAVRERKIK